MLVAADPASKPAWFELAPTTAGTSGRVALPSPAQVRVGRSDPPWPTPAEGYLAALAPVTTISIGTSGTVAEAGPEKTAKIVAMVADSLIAVGALPVTSTLLREVSGSDPGWHVQLARRVGPPRPPAGRQIPGGGASQAGRSAAAGARHGRDRERLRPR